MRGLAEAERGQRGESEEKIDSTFKARRHSIQRRTVMNLP